MGFADLIKLPWVQNVFLQGLTFPILSIFHPSWRTWKLAQWGKWLKENDFQEKIPLSLDHWPSLTNPEQLFCDVSSTSQIHRTEFPPLMGVSNVNKKSLLVHISYFCTFLGCCKVLMAQLPWWGTCLSPDVDRLQLPPVPASMAMGDTVQHLEGPRSPAHVERHAPQRSKMAHHNYNGYIKLKDTLASPLSIWIKIEMMSSFLSIQVSAIEYQRWSFPFKSFCLEPAT